ncbi:metal-sensitive transcriptional regulator [Chitinophaga japonensis]|uniref:Metal-sensitive transcriptional repressor n=1 Tax=Chitinophaga japonensis TaxID=104662 RepID=A0A562SMW4_CHIJA|nr:metal-sensitive transcriptional regulator [Chitinophaga japonensis]TWI82582.1 metal-sensitive transcriptional repressor [Chitinophaga japonensis]
MLPKELTGDLTKRLSTIKGQIEGIINMLQEGKDPDQILNQFKAADQGLQKAHFLLLDEVFRKSLALKLVKVMNACPGNCPDAQKIEILKEQFPLLQDSELTHKIKEINEIGERLARYNEENSKKSEK